LFIIDSGSNRRFTALVSRLHSSLPTAKILVFSATPTWKETREAMYAGANDYCRKLLNKDEILEKVGQLIGPPDE
jgi:DNA-binding NarL/FixJ family response regulator